MASESPTRPWASPLQVWRDLNPIVATNGLIGFIFAATGPVAVILSVGAAGGLSEPVIASWIFGVFFLNGLLTVAFSTRWRMPMVFFWTIPGAVLVGPALQHLSFQEVVGAFVATGLLILVLGASGWVRRAMQAVPMPIVMGMVAGVFLKFGTGLVTAVRDDLAIALPMVLAFVALSARPDWARRAPPLIVALLVGLAAIALTGRFDAPAGPGGPVLAAPVWQVPQWSLPAMIELVVPLAITVLAAQNGQGFAVLAQAGHTAPINAVTVACGAWSTLAAFVGGVSTCLTGPTNALVVSGGERERHYAGAVVCGLLAVGFGLLAPLFTRWLLATPPVFIAALAGLAMLKVLQGAFVTAFRDRHALGALVAFLVTVADVSIANIGAPFWGLVFGVLVSRLLEPADFAAPR